MHGTFILNIDWALLRSQKAYLLNLPECDELNGIISLIDAIQDEAVDSGEFSEQEVFDLPEMDWDEV